MLVLTRKPQQQIKIGNDVVISVLRVRGKQVQIGIEAPRSVRVLRAEVPAHEPPGAERREEAPIRMAGRRFGRPAPRATLAWA
jgi:carbon storage regulator CsrA